MGSSTQQGSRPNINKPGWNGLIRRKRDVVRRIQYGSVEPYSRFMYHPCAADYNMSVPYLSGVPYWTFACNSSALCDYVGMIKLLEEAIARISALPPEAQ
jgi:hypothetical protein